jgi:hypothetical protein
MKPVSQGEREMVDEVAGLNAFSQIFDIAKSIKDMNDKRSEAISKLWGQIIATQKRYEAAVAQIRELEGELTKLKVWQAERERCQLCDLRKCTASLAWNHSTNNNQRDNFICPDSDADEYGLIVKTNRGPAPGRTWIPDFDF